MQEPKWVGSAYHRLEDRRLLVGSGHFIADYAPLPGIAYAAIVRSPHAHALIRNIDVGTVAAMPGVLGILTSEHIKQWAHPFPLAVDLPIKYYPLAIERVRYVGEPVAVIIAETPYIAADAVEQMRVTYEPLPTVVDPEEACRPSAPLLHPNIGTNIGNSRHFVFGNPNLAFEQADLVIQEQFVFPRHTCLPLEPYGVIAHYDHVDTSVTLWANFHGPFVLHTLVAQALGLPPNAVRLIVPQDIGGSFGIKAGLYPYMVLIALASRLVKRPVKWIETRQEHLLASSFGAGRIASVQAAFDSKGLLCALRYRFIDDVGAYIRSPEPASLFRCFGNLVGPYRVQNLEVETIAVMTNKAPTGLNRGFGGPQLYFALERVMDIAAERLGIDPVEIRKRNFIPPECFPYQTPSGGVYDSGNYPKALDQLLSLCQYEHLRHEQAKARAQGRLYGIGVATIIDPSGTNIGYITLAQTPEERIHGLPKSGSTEFATLSIDPLGNITLKLMTTPQGQGHETVAAQIVADELGIPPDRIRVLTEMDTNLLPWTITTGSYSSRFAPLASSAIARATRELREKLRRIAAHALEVAPEDLEYDNAVFRVRGAPEKFIPLRRVAGIAHWNPTALPSDLEPNLEITCSFSPSTNTPPDSSDRINSSTTYGFVADLAVVEIDPLTCTVKVLRYFSVHDAGRILNPIILQGQAHGALAHGLGIALGEEILYDEYGQPLTSTLLDYSCLRASQVPSLHIDHLETPSPLTLLGAKGGGEGHTMSAPAAIANAVADALRPLNISVTHLPIKANWLFDQLKERGYQYATSGSTSLCGR